jgi:hypothetical protein
MVSTSHKPRGAFDVSYGKGMRLETEWTKDHVLQFRVFDSRGCLILFTTDKKIALAAFETGVV